MPPTKDVKRAAVELWKASVPLKKIRAQLRIPERSLRRILDHAKKNSDAPIAERKPGSGRPSVISRELKIKIKELLRKKPTLTAKQIKSTFPELQQVSVRTIQHACLKDLKLPSRKMAKKPLLNERMKAQRLEFAMQYRNWSANDWKKVMFSDESHFELRFGNQGDRCRRPVGSDRFDSSFTKKTVKHPQKVMAWACFSWKGRGGIEFLDQGEMMNGIRYLRVLEDKLEYFMQSHGTTHFLQDGAPCHKAKIVTRWFEARPNISLIRWPGNSPDLNPIENVWSWMKRQLKEVPCTNLVELKQEILKLWCQKMDDCEYLRHLVESMPRRLEEVIQREGGMTKY